MNESTESSGEDKTWGDVGLEIMASIEAKEELSPKQQMQYALAFGAAQLLAIMKNSLSEAQKHKAGAIIWRELVKMGRFKPE